jgi:hypothetical protein
MSRFVPVDRDTAYLLPPSVDEWLPDDHLARFVVEVIDRLDSSGMGCKELGQTRNDDVARDAAGHVNANSPTRVSSCWRFS